MVRTGQPRKSARASETGRRTELIEAALVCFSERGFAATKLEDVAARVGVSKGSVYLHFESKEKLFEAVVRAAVTPTVDHSHALVDAFEGTTPDLLRALLLVFETSLQGSYPSIVKLVAAESGNFPELARLWAALVLRPGLALMRRVIERGIERKEFRPVDPEVAVHLVMAPVILVALWTRSLGQHVDIKLDTHAILVEHAETLLRGLAASGGGTASPRAP